MLRSLSENRSSNADSPNKLCEQILSLCEESSNSRSGSRVESTAKASLAKLLEDLRTIKVENVQSEKKKEGNKSRPIFAKKAILPPLNLTQRLENSIPITKLKNFLGINKNENSDAHASSDRDSVSHFNPTDLFEKDKRSIGTQTETRLVESTEDRTLYSFPLSKFQEKAAFDILTNIFGCLDAPSICKASRVCLLWKTAAENWYVWRLMFLNHYGMPPGDEEPYAYQWKSKFIERYNTTEHLFEDHDRGIVTYLKAHSMCQIKVSSSSLKRGSITDFISSEDVHVWTENSPFSWFAVDLGEGKAACPKQYRLKYGSSGNYCCPRNWMLQATNDLEALKGSNSPDPLADYRWDTLSKHVNDTNISTSFASFTWDLPHISKSYRIFRIIQTGPNSYYTGKPQDDWSNVLVVSGFELFGILKQRKTNTQEVGIIQSLGGHPIVQVYASSVDKGTHADFISTKNTFFWTKNLPMSWVGVDLGKGKTALPTHYKLKYGSSGEACCPRNWLLQASNNPDVFRKEKYHDIHDPSWHTISVHHNDTSLDSSFAEHIWNITCKQPFRCFRVIQVARNKYPHNPGQKDEWSDVFVVTGFELYGKLFTNQK